MFKLILLPLFFFGTAFAEVELHSAVKEDFYKGNWAYIYPNYGDKPEQARISDITVNDTLFTVDVGKHCKSCPAKWSDDLAKYNKPYIYAFTNLYESPDFKGIPYQFAITVDSQGVFINPKGEELITPLIVDIGYPIIKFPVIRKKEFSAIWHPKEKRFLFAKNPSYYLIAIPEEGQSEAVNVNDKDPYLYYELNPQTTFYSADQKKQLKFENFSDSNVQVEKAEKDGVRINIRDLSCGRGKSNVIAGVCIKPGYLLDYYSCGKETEAFIKNEGLILANGEMALFPKEVIKYPDTGARFIHLNRTDHLVFPDEIVAKIQNGTVTEEDLPLKYRLVGIGGATNNLNIEIYERPSMAYYNEKFHFSFKPCDPKTGKLQ